MISASTTNVVALFALTPKLVTAITPLWAVAGSVAVICVAEFTTKDAIAVPESVTAVAPVKLVPVITTPVAFDRACAGVKLVTVGALPTLNVAVELTDIPAFLTVITPERFPLSGNGIVIWVAELIV